MTTNNNDDSRTDQRNHSRMPEQTPLHLAVSNGRDDMVQTLVKAGADVKAVDEYGHTLLHIAVYKWTPLHSAVYEGSECVDDPTVRIGSKVRQGDRRRCHHLIQDPNKWL